MHLWFSSAVALTDVAIVSNCASTSFTSDTELLQSRLLVCVVFLGHEREKKKKKDGLGDECE